MNTRYYTEYIKKPDNVIAKKKQITVPTGFERVLSGRCIDGDRFYHVHQNKFITVSKRHLGKHWFTFDCLIRKG